LDARISSSRPADNIAFLGTERPTVTNPRALGAEKARIPSEPTAGIEPAKIRITNAAQCHSATSAGGGESVAEPAFDVKPARTGRLTKRLTAAQVVAIRERRACGEKSVPLARAFGISQSMVCLITLGKVHADAGGPLTRRRVKLSSGLIERIRQHAIASADANACHGWSGYTNENGYAVVNFGGRVVLAHKSVLEQKLGRKLRDGEVSRHTCHVRHCTNERHLVPGSQADNVRDMVEAGRSLIGEADPASKLTERDVLDIRERASLGRVNYEALGRLHGVTGACIKKVIKGKTWRHLLPGAAAVTTATKGAA
jgi:hypothetical protein